MVSGTHGYAFLVQQLPYLGSGDAVGVLDNLTGRGAAVNVF